MKHTLTQPQAAALRILVQEGSVPYGYGRFGRSMARLVREGLAVVRGATAEPTAAGIAWVERALAKRMAEATAAHGTHLPSHLRGDFDESIAALARAHDRLAGRAS